MSKTFLDSDKEAPAKEVDRSSLSDKSQLSDDYLRQQIGQDAVLGRKMVHVNRAINQIGFTRYHLKLYAPSRVSA